MTLCLGNCSRPTFLFNGNPLENVDSYNYLGLFFSKNGNMSKMIQDLINKANRAAFVLKKALSVGQNVSVKLAMTLFDKQISPILLYCCPLRAITEQYSTVKISMDVGDIPANKMSFIKDLFVSLNVNLSSSDIISIWTNQKGDILCDLKMLHVGASY